MGLTSNSLVVNGNYRNYPTSYQTVGGGSGNVATSEDDMFKAFVEAQDMEDA